MATLVLSTIGTALGGPVGAAIGGLIGQSIDSQVLSPASRGPRLGDLAVQSSSYGTQVPRVYGMMRVAGSVIWATDLAESAETTGAKGQPDTTFSYSVSLAVALSSRPLLSIGRIWADGKLLRGADGVFKVSTTFRFYDGSEDQIIDPLIGSIEGLANTPAYRGLALAVFENLELAEFGNRIPFLTFEVVADAEAVPVAEILRDASGGLIEGQHDHLVVGYGAYGGSIRASVEPLVRSHALQLFDDGVHVRGASDTTVITIDENELGSSNGNEAAPRIERDRGGGSSAPGALRLSYYDPARDYQSGEARASAGELNGGEERVELPAVLSADDAKSLAHQIMARSWAERDRVTVRLAPSRLDLEPAAQVSFPGSPNSWLVERCTIDGFVVVVEMKAAPAARASLPAAAGRLMTSADAPVGELRLAMFEAPESETPDEKMAVLAASSDGPGWRRQTVEVSCGGRTHVVHTAARKAVLGRVLDVPDRGEDAVEVALHDREQWLVSCTEDDLAKGDNLALLGEEFIQFGEATPLGDGRFRLGRLLRGRMGSERAIDHHSVGEPFVLIDRAALQPLPMPDWTAGMEVRAAARDGSAECRLVRSRAAGEASSPPTRSAARCGPSRRRPAGS